MGNKKVAIMGLESLNNYGDNFIIDCVKYLVDDLNIYQSKVVDFEPEINRIKKLIYYFLLCGAKISPSKRIRDRLIFIAVKFRCRKYTETN